MAVTNTWMISYTYIARMSLLKYFKPALPTPAQSSIGDSLTAAANKEVEKITGVSASRKRKRYATYSDEYRSKIGWYAAENGNT